jgi:hypothetical protein
MDEHNKNKHAHVLSEYLLLNFQNSRWDISGSFKSPHREWGTMYSAKMTLVAPVVCGYMQKTSRGVVLTR